MAKSADIEGFYDSWAAGAALLAQTLRQAWEPFAPQNLFQPILPGWSFGNLTINEQNSSSPAAERAIVAAESYGRQLGRITDALAALIEAQPAAARTQPAYAQLLQMHQRIDAIKADARNADLARLKTDLAALKKNQPLAFKHLLASL